MSRFLSREYIGGGVVGYLELEDETYFVLVGGLGKHPVVRAGALRERRARRKFDEVVVELNERFAAEGWKWNR